MKKQATIKLTLELDNIYQVMALRNILGKIKEDKLNNPIDIKVYQSLKDLADSIL